MIPRVQGEVGRGTSVALKAQWGIWHSARLPEQRTRTPCWRGTRRGDQPQDKVCAQGGLLPGEEANRANRLAHDKVRISSKRRGGTRVLVSVWVRRLLCTRDVTDALMLLSSPEAAELFPLLLIWDTSSHSHPQLGNPGVNGQPLPVALVPFRNRRLGPKAKFHTTRAPRGDF